MSQRLLIALIALALGALATWWLLAVTGGSSKTPERDETPSLAPADAPKDEGAPREDLEAPNASRSEREPDRLPPRLYERVRLEVLVQAPLGRELESPVRVLVEPAFDDGGTPVARLEREAQLLSSPPSAALARFDDLLPSSYRVLARAPKLDSVFTLVELDARIPLLKISLTLAPLGTLEGVVHTGEDSRAIAAFAPLALQRVERDLDGQRPRFETLADGNGRFRFEDLAPGSYDLVVGPAGRTLRAPIRVEIGEGASAQDVGGLPPVGEVALQAYDEAGNALAGVTFDVVPADPEGKGGGRGTTDAEGVLRLGGLLTGTYLIHAQREGYHPLQTRLELTEIPPVPLQQPVVLRER